MKQHSPLDDPDDFAEHLRAQPSAALPPEWRTEILSAAWEAIPARPPLRRRVAAELRLWLWPHPLAGGALVAAWLLILAFWLMTPAVSPEPAGSRMAWHAGESHEDSPALAADRALLLAHNDPDGLNP
jgi:hypothetical protein